MNYVSKDQRKPKLPKKQQIKPRWAQSHKWQGLLKALVTERSKFFEGYAFNGVTYQGKYYDRNECAEAIVDLSNLILDIMRDIGRQPLGMTSEELNLKPQPTVDKDWERRIKQRFAIYTSVDELKEQTRGITGARYYELEKITL